MMEGRDIAIPGRRMAVVAIIMAAVMVGCQQPGEVQVREDDFGVDVVPIAPADTAFGLTAIDSTAVMPGDQILFDGVFVVNSLKHDAGNGVVTTSFARVFVADRERPVTGMSGNQIGFHGFHLGTVFMNGLPMMERLHVIPGVDTIIVAGFEYTNPPAFAYMPGIVYTWSVDTIGTEGLSIEAPGIVTVNAPRGGAIVPSDRALELRWQSDGDVSVVVSLVDRFGRPHPLLHLRPRGDGLAIVPPKVLQLLPRDATYFLTFIRANRSEITVGRNFLQGTVLVQAASVYTSVIHLR